MVPVTDLPVISSVLDDRPLVTLDAIRFQDGGAETLVEGVPPIADVGGTRLFASYDTPTPGYTTVWAVSEPGFLPALDAGLLALAGARRRGPALIRPTGTPPADRRRSAS